jgi:hypothetical protein
MNYYIIIFACSALYAAPETNIPTIKNRAEQQDAPAPIAINFALAEPLNNSSIINTELNNQENLMMSLDVRNISAHFIRPKPVMPLALQNIESKPQQPIEEEFDVTTQQLKEWLKLSKERTRGTQYAHIAQNGLSLAQERAKMAEQQQQVAEKRMSTLAQQAQDAQNQALRAQECASASAKSAQEFIQAQHTLVTTLEKKAESIDQYAHTLQNTLHTNNTALKTALKDETTALKNETVMLRGENSVLRQEIDTLRGSVKDLSAVNENKRRAFYRSIVIKLLGN